MKTASFAQWLELRKTLPIHKIIIKNSGFDVIYRQFRDRDSLERFLNKKDNGIKWRPCMGTMEAYLTEEESRK